MAKGKTTTTAAVVKVALVYDRSVWMKLARIDADKLVAGKGKDAYSYVAIPKPGDFGGRYPVAADGRQVIPVTLSDGVWQVVDGGGEGDVKRRALYLTVKGGAIVGRMTWGEFSAALGLPSKGSRSETPAAALAAGVTVL